MCQVFKIRIYMVLALSLIGGAANAEQEIADGEVDVRVDWNCPAHMEGDTCKWVCDTVTDFEMLSLNSLNTKYNGRLEVGGVVNQSLEFDVRGIEAVANEFGAGTVKITGATGHGYNLIGQKVTVTVDVEANFWVEEKNETCDHIGTKTHGKCYTMSEGARKYYGVYEDYRCYDTVALTGGLINVGKENITDENMFSPRNVDYRDGLLYYEKDKFVVDFDGMNKEFEAFKDELKQEAVNSGQELASVELGIATKLATIESTRTKIQMKAGEIAEKYGNPSSPDGPDFTQLNELELDYIDAVLAARSGQEALREKIAILEEAKENWKLHSDGQIKLAETCLTDWNRREYIWGGVSMMLNPCLYLFAIPALAAQLAVVPAVLTVSVVAGSVIWAAKATAGATVLRAMASNAYDKYLIDEDWINRMLAGVELMATCGFNIAAWEELIFGRTTRLKEDLQKVRDAKEPELDTFDERIDAVQMDIDALLILEMEMMIKAEMLRSSINRLFTSA